MTYMLCALSGVVLGAVGMAWTIRPAVLDQARDDGYDAGWHDATHAAPYQLHNHHR